MDQILLCSNHIPLTTSINNTFIQNYMLNANGSYVKVYLYLSMCIQSGKENLSISSLADMMENTEKDILRALRYWEKQGLMVLQKDEESNAITGIEITNPDKLADSSSKKKAQAEEVSVQKTQANEPAVQKVQKKETKVLADESVIQTSEPVVQTGESATQADESVTHSKRVHTGSSTVMPKADTPDAHSDLPANNSDNADAVESSSTQKRIADITAVSQEQITRLSQDDTFSWTCLIVESYLERPLKPGEVQLLTYLYDTLQFSKELILYLYEYCCSLGKTNVKYVQTVALSWADHKITTPEQAQQYSSNYNAAYTAISKALALGRPLAGIERQYAERWQNEWNIDLSVILEACNRTMLAIQKPDFKYIDGILSHWHKENVHTLQDVKVCDENYNKKKSAGRSADTKRNASGNTTGNKPNRNQFQNFQQRNASPEEMKQLEKLLLTQ
ncbi:MAG: DnaD domain protein [Butyribacter sp.]|nr:DnaD domain protein [Butyribacter sp.]